MMWFILIFAACVLVACASDEDDSDTDCVIVSDDDDDNDGQNTGNVVIPPAVNDGDTGPIAVGPVNYDDGNDDGDRNNRFRVARDAFLEFADLQNGVLSTNRQADLMQAVKEFPLKFEKANYLMDSNVGYNEDTVPLSQLIKDSADADEDVPIELELKIDGHVIMSYDMYQSGYLGGAYFKVPTGEGWGNKMFELQAKLKRKTTFFNKLHDGDYKYRLRRNANTGAWERATPVGSGVPLDSREVKIPMPCFEIGKSEGSTVAICGIVPSTINMHRLMEPEERIQRFEEFGEKFFLYYLLPAISATPDATTFNRYRSYLKTGPTEGRWLTMGVDEPIRITSVDWHKVARTLDANMAEYTAAGGYEIFYVTYSFGKNIPVSRDTNWPQGELNQWMSAMNIRDFDEEGRIAYMNIHMSHCFRGNVDNAVVLFNYTNITNDYHWVNAPGGKNLEPFPTLGFQEFSSFASVKGLDHQGITNIMHGPNFEQLHRSISSICRLVQDEDGTAVRVGPAGNYYKDKLKIVYLNSYLAHNHHMPAHKVHGIHVSHTATGMWLSGITWERLTEFAKDVRVIKALLASMKGGYTEWRLEEVYELDIAGFYHEKTPLADDMESIVKCFLKGLHADFFGDQGGLIPREIDDVPFTVKGLMPNIVLHKNFVEKVVNNVVVVYTMMMCPLLESLTDTVLNANEEGFFGHLPPGNQITAGAGDMHKLVSVTLAENVLKFMIDGSFHNKDGKVLRSALGTLSEPPRFPFVTMSDGTCGGLLEQSPTVTRAFVTSLDAHWMPYLLPVKEPLSRGGNYLTRLVTYCPVIECTMDFALSQIYAMTVLKAMQHFHHPLLPRNRREVNMGTGRDRYVPYPVTGWLTTANYQAQVNLDQPVNEIPVNDVARYMKMAPFWKYTETIAAQILVLTDQNTVGREGRQNFNLCLRQVQQGITARLPNTLMSMNAEGKLDVFYRKEVIMSNEMHSDPNKAIQPRAVVNMNRQYARVVPERDTLFLYDDNGLRRFDFGIKPEVARDIVNDVLDYAVKELKVNRNLKNFDRITFPINIIIFHIWYSELPGRMTIPNYETFIKYAALCVVMLGQTWPDPNRPGHHMLYMEFNEQKEWMRNNGIDDDDEKKLVAMGLYARPREPTQADRDRRVWPLEKQVYRDRFPYWWGKQRAQFLKKSVWDQYHDDAGFHGAYGEDTLRESNMIPRRFTDWNRRQVFFNANAELRTQLIQPRWGATTATRPDTFDMRAWTYKNWCTDGNFDGQQNKVLLPPTVYLFYDQSESGGVLNQKAPLVMSIRQQDRLKVWPNISPISTQVTVSNPMFNPVFMDRFGNSWKEHDYCNNPTGLGYRDLRPNFRFICRANVEVRYGMALPNQPHLQTGQIDDVQSMLEEKMYEPPGESSGASTDQSQPQPQPGTGGSAQSMVNQLVDMAQDHSAAVANLDDGNLQTDDLDELEDIVLDRGLIAQRQIDNNEQREEDIAFIVPERRRRGAPRKTKKGLPPWLQRQHRHRHHYPSNYDDSEDENE